MNDIQLKRLLDMAIELRMQGDETGSRLLTTAWSEIQRLYRECNRLEDYTNILERLTGVA